MSREAQELRVLLTKFHGRNPDLDRWLAWLDKMEVIDATDRSQGDGGTTGA